MRDTPYDRRRTLTAAYRAELASPLTIFLPYRPSGFFKTSFFLICAEAISARFLFLRYRGDGKCRDKTVTKTQEESSCRFGFLRSFLRLQYCSILMAVRFSGGAF